jgi:hypothetical protein
MVIQYRTSYFMFIAQTNTNTNTEIELIKDVIKIYEETGSVNLVNILILIIASIVVIQNHISKIRLLKTTTGNIIAYINKDSVKQKKKIEQILIELRALTDADRVVVGLFHNGTSVGSFHFTKLSLAYESLKTGITSLRKRYKDIDVTGIEDELLTYQSDKFTRNAISDVNVDNGCKQYLNSIGLEAVYTRLIPVNGEKNNYYGVIQIQFASEHNDEISEDRLKEIEKTYNRLLTALDFVRRNKRIPD